MQSAQIRVRLNTENFEYLRRLADEAGLQQIDVASMLVHAGLSALKDAGESVPFPLKFQVREERKNAKAK